MERQATFEEWTNTSLRTNLEMYFVSRSIFSRFHYSDIYGYAVSIVKYVEVDTDAKREQKKKILAKLTDFYNSPFRTYFMETGKRVTLKERNLDVPFSRIEYIVHQYTANRVIGRGLLGKHINIAGNDDITLGELIDLCEMFKRTIHETLTDYLIENKVNVDALAIPNFANQIKQVGFLNASRN